MDTIFAFPEFASGHKIKDMTIEQIAAEALQLPAQQRALLAESLWISLEDIYTAPREMDDSVAVQLAFERDRQIESGEVSTVSHVDMMAKLRE